MGAGLMAVDPSRYNKLDCERSDDGESHAGHLWSYGQWDESGDWWDENNYWCPGLPEAQNREE